MKNTLSIVGMIIAVSLLIVGCAKQNQVDTAKLESSFSSAEPASKSEVDKAVSAVKSADYSSALASLQKVASQAKLTPEQQQAVKDVITQIQKQLGAAVEKAGGDAQKALDSAKQGVPKP
jgi:hypothetical protein